MLLTVYGATVADRAVLVRYLGLEKVPPLLCGGVLEIILPNRRDAVQNTAHLLEMLDLPDLGQTP